MNAPADHALRVAILSELPTPYRWPLFQRVATVPGLDVTILFYARSEADRDWGLEIEASSCPVVQFLPGRAFHVRRKRSLFFHWNSDIGQRLRKGRFDVVVVPGWSMPSSLVAMWTCRRARIPYVLFSETNDLSPRPAWLRWLKLRLLRPMVSGASAWLATGTLSARFLERHGARAAGIHRFANTPDVEALAAAVDARRSERGATRRLLGVPADVPLAVFVGRLIGAKGVATLVRAQARVEAAGSSLWTVVVGDGAEGDSLRATARELSIRQMVFAGSRRPHELPAIWAASDLFVLPSFHEPWGVVVNEAMSAGLPVVLSDRVGAAGDLLQEGVTGRGFPAGDDQALANVLSDLARDHTRRGEMGGAARRLVGAWGYGPSVEGFEAAVREAATSR
jgi:glycosyltransferase involved in cell wall biosynthesis